MDTPPKQYGREYTDVTLRCEVKGGDKPILSWSTENGQMPRKCLLSVEMLKLLMLMSVSKYCKFLIQINGMLFLKDIPFYLKISSVLKGKLCSVYLKKFKRIKYNIRKEILRINI